MPSFGMLVEGFVPALPTDNFVKLARPKGNIKAKHFEDHITSNIAFGIFQGHFLNFFSRSPVLR
jgi:hypothetical protein